MVDINTFYKGDITDAGDEVIRISTSLRKSDKIFLQQRGFKVSKVLKSAIQELRDYEEGGVNFKFANHQLQKKIAKLSNWVTSIGDIIEQTDDKELKEKVANVFTK